MGILSPETEVTTQPEQSSWLAIDEGVLQAAAEKKFGPGATCSAPYWMDPAHALLRCGIFLPEASVAFGANFDAKQGLFL